MHSERYLERKANASLELHLAVIIIVPLPNRTASCIQVVYSALCPEAGGNISASLEEVVAKMARAKVCVPPLPHHE